MAEGRGHGRRAPATFDAGLAARGRHLAAAGQHLPAPRAGRVVRRRGAAAPAREEHTGPVRRRLRDGVRGGPRRRTGAGGAGQALREVWADAPS